MCATRPGVGPGTPRFEDAPSGYGEALTILDFAQPDDPRRAAALDLVVSTARRRDVLTLWHLVSRGTPAERHRVYDRLATLAPPPSGVTREAVVGGDRRALNRIGGVRWVSRPPRGGRSSRRSGDRSHASARPSSLAWRTDAADDSIHPTALEHARRGPGRWVPVVIITAAVGIQFVRLPRTNPPTDPSRTLAARTPLTPEAAGVLDRACRENCHSNDTRWPW